VTRHEGERRVRRIFPPLRKNRQAKKGEAGERAYYTSQWQRSDRTKNRGVKPETTLVPPFRVGYRNFQPVGGRLGKGRSSDEKNWRPAGGVLGGRLRGEKFFPGEKKKVHHKRCMAMSQGRSPHARDVSSLLRRASSSRVPSGEGFRRNINAVSSTPTLCPKGPWGQGKKRLSKEQLPMH